MIYEFSVNKIASGKMDSARELFGKELMNQFKKHGIKVVGMWETRPPYLGTTHRIYYMLEFKDMADREEAWKRFRDPYMAELKARNIRDGTYEIIVESTNSILQSIV